MAAETRTSGLVKSFSVQLAVSDLDTTEAFYAGILGVPLLRTMTAPGFPEYLVMEQSDWTLVFNEEALVVNAHPVLEEQFESFPRGVGMTLHFRVQGIEEIYEALLNEGLEILYPLEEKPYGFKEVWCFDPDGYLVVLAEPR
ncbi:MAG: glyoxalase/bleomycin resistance protein/dioxygenase superfamily protein [Geobacteraceae bacterium]|nr:glyoxalase/bleomycin resistance protein/dioxygenase superfamily protein [Geobacteraceae bacterium]